MNNKEIGNSFENKIVKKLASLGYWVHFLSPDSRGAQPFDILAIKGDRILAIDCKTCQANSFSMTRLEDNQKYAFEAILKKTKANAVLAVEHDAHVFIIPYSVLKILGKINLKQNKMVFLPDLEVELNEE